MSKLAKYQLQDVSSKAAAMPAVKCPLSPTLLLQSFRSSTGLRTLQEIEEHVSKGDCHPPLKDVVLHRLLDGTTPMMLACNYGDLDCVKRLVQTWKVDINASAVYYTDLSDEEHYFSCKNLRVRSATPLFVAAFNSHVEVVRYLLEKGANVSSKTCSDSNTFYDGLTPLNGILRSYFDSDYFNLAKVNAIVPLLLQFGANPSALPSDGRPIWMESLMYDASTTITLINHGMNLHQKNSAGETVLHGFADLNYHHESLTGNDLLTILQLLVEKGADLMARDNNNFTPILTAANSSNWTALDFLLERDEIHRTEKIDALEMVSVKELHTFKRYPDPNDPDYQRIFGYWRQALRLRGKEDPKIPLTLKSGRAGEWTTEEELEYVIQHSSEYHLQMYLAKLRIFSTRNLWSLFSTRADDRIFRRYLNSLQNSCKFFQHQDIISATFKTISEAINRFDSQDIPSGLCEMSYRCVDLFFWMLEEFDTTQLIHLFDEIFNAKTFKFILKVLVATSPFCSTVRNPSLGNDHLYMNRLLMLVIRLAKLPGILTKGKNETIKASLRKLVMQNSRDSHGRTLLHIMLNEEMLLNTKDVPTIRLLLKCGVSVNASDVSGDSPLHLLVSNRWGANAVLDCVGRLFTEYGANLNQVNKNGETAAQLWTRIKKRDPPEWLRNDIVVKLSSLSARIIRSHQVPYNDETLPAHLHSFVEL